MYYINRPIIKTPVSILQFFLQIHSSDNISATTEITKY